MRPKCVDCGELRFIGVEVRTTNDIEESPVTARIPGIWQRCKEEQLFDQLPHRVHPDIWYGVYTKYESDYTGEYSFAVAAEVDRVLSVPAGMVSVSLPPATYLVFRRSGALPYAVIEAWKEIWEYFARLPKYRRTYTGDFERYEPHEAGEPTRVEVYVSVEKVA
jgi:predicted transcriptional regulator YdeE